MDSWELDTCLVWEVDVGEKKGTDETCGVQGPLRDRCGSHPNVAKRATLAMGHPLLSGNWSRLWWTGEGARLSTLLRCGCELHHYSTSGVRLTVFQVTA